MFLRNCVFAVAFVCAASIIHAAEPQKLSLVGKDLSAWKKPAGQWTLAESISLNPTNQHLFLFKPGTNILINGPTGKTAHLKSNYEHGDCRAQVEFCVSSNSNSGIYFQGRYEIQILDSWGVEQPDYGDCGGIYQRWKNDKGYEGRAPRLNASKPPGEWQTFDIIFRAPRFDAAGKKIENARFIEVVHNGKTIHQDVELSGPTRSGMEPEVARGPILIQGNHGPVAFRKFVLTPLDLK